MHNGVSSVIAVIIQYDWLVLYCWVLGIVAWQVAYPIPGLALAAIVLPLFLYLRYRKQQPLAYMRLTSGPVAAGIGWGLLLGIVLVISSLSRAWLWKSGPLYWHWTWQDWTRLALVAALTEELFFRGFVLQSLGEKLNFRTANSMTALLFLFCHSFVWLDSGLTGIAWLEHGLYIFLLGLILGYSFRASGSLWTPLVIHCANNTAALLALGLS